MGKQFLRYLRQNLALVILCLGWGLILAGIWLLYRVEIEAILYTVLLGGLLGVIFLTVRFVRFYQRHQQLERVKANVSLLVSKLPEGGQGLEADYQEIIELLNKEHQEILTGWQNWKNDSVEYYSTWVHQIKMPIAIMKLILQGQDREEDQELLYELFRVEQYTEMVLGYFRLDESGNDLVIEHYDLDSIIKRVIRKYAGQFIRRPISLDYSGTDIKVLTDEKWLEFILEQLLSNALKYTVSGKITITVGADKLLTVKDTGIGIQQEDLPRIFERGFTGYNGRLNKKSTGIGLYLCKRAADMLSHSLQVQSKVGEGSSFTLNLASTEVGIE